MCYIVFHIRAEAGSFPDKRRKDFGSRVPQLVELIGEPDSSPGCKVGSYLGLLDAACMGDFSVSNLEISPLNAILTGLIVICANLAEDSEFTEKSEKPSFSNDHSSLGKYLCVSSHLLAALCHLYRLSEP